MENSACLECYGHGYALLKPAPAEQPDDDDATCSQSADGTIWAAEAAAKLFGRRRPPLADVMRGKA